MSCTHKRVVQVGGEVPQYTIDISGTFICLDCGNKINPFEFDSNRSNIFTYENLYFIVFIVGMCAAAASISWN